MSSAVVCGPQLVCCRGHLHG